MNQPGNSPVECAVYRCARQDEMYIYLPADTAPDTLPEGLRQRTGALEHVMDLTLTAQRQLARVSAAQVMQALKTTGYFVQLPDNPLTVNLYRGD